MCESDKKNDFICGVVEGFYGRPWTTEQRKDLFRKLKKWGMDSYVYAPKDDYKHRAYWRDLYTVEEADHLTGLITAAKEQGIVFYYALSPGLDMSYSNQKEVLALKRKLDQVSQFGCDAFALLFDDIEPELSKTDKEVFQTFANAQVSVTNEIFTHLNNPKFLFCPTQYCSSRALPNVAESEYLNTLGTKLYPQINIMWTGTKVISKNFTIESIQEITEILHRAPIIWDNIHANDYDQKRVFLGPYSGRSPELIPLLKGVLTNPNCEFHANTIAIHTLAYWSKCSLDTKVNISISADIKLETENDDGTTNENIPNCLSSKNIYHPRVALKNALLDWLPEFSIEKAAFGPISKPQPQVTMPILPIIPSLNTCMSLTTTTITSSTSGTTKIPEISQLQVFAEVATTISTTAPIMTSYDSLVSPTKVITNDIPNIVNPVVSNIEIPKKIPVSSITVPIMNLNSIVAEKESNCINIIGGGEKMDNFDELLEDSDQKSKHVILEDEDVPIAEIPCDEMTQSTMKTENVEIVDSNSPQIEKSSKNDEENLPMVDENLSSPLPPQLSEPMECGSNVSQQTSPMENNTRNYDVVMSETSNSSPGISMQVENSDMFSNTDEIKNEKIITIEDLYLLCDLFYLPFEHGNRGLQLLNEFNWLKTHANIILNSKKKDDRTKPEVQEWYDKSVKFSGLCQSVIMLSQKIANCVNKELCHDLFSYCWDITGIITILNAFVKWLGLGYFPSNINSYTMGSYTWFSKGWKEAFMSGDQEPWVFRGGLIADLQRLIPVDNGNDLFIYKFPDAPTNKYYSIRPYKIIDESQLLSVFSKVINQNNEIPENLQHLIADRYIVPFLTLSSEFCLLIQDDERIVGFACAALDSRIFYRNQEVCWIPEMCSKYPQTLSGTDDDVMKNLKDNIDYFHNFKYECPQEVFNLHPSEINCYILKEDLELDNSIGKRLITVLFAALRSNASFGAHICVDENDRNLIDFHIKLGFSEIYRDKISSKIYFGRSF